MVNLSIWLSGPMTQNISKIKLNLINVKIGKFKHMAQWLTEAEDLIYTLLFRTGLLTMSLKLIKVLKNSLNYYFACKFYTGHR